MFQSVTYTGFERHPERRAWVEGVVMPSASAILRGEGNTMSLHWHDPELPGATAYQLDELVRRDMLPDWGDRPLVGQVNGYDAAAGVSLLKPGLLLVLRSDRLPAGWTYMPVPVGGEVIGRLWLEAPIHAIYREMLGTAIRQRLAGRDEDLMPAGA